PLDVAGDGEDRRPRREAGLPVTLERLAGDLFDRLGGAAAITPQRHRPVPAAEFDHHLRPRLVLQSLEILDRERLHCFELILGQMRPAEDVAVNLESGEDIASERRAPEAEMHLPDRLVAVETEIVESKSKGPAVAVAGAADDHLGEDGG